MASPRAHPRWLRAVAFVRLSCTCQSVRSTRRQHRGASRARTTTALGRRHEPDAPRHERDANASLLRIADRDAQIAAAPPTPPRSRAPPAASCARRFHPQGLRAAGARTGDPVVRLAPGHRHRPAVRHPDRRRPQRGRHLRRLGRRLRHARRGGPGRRLRHDVLAHVGVHREGRASSSSPASSSETSAAPATRLARTCTSRSTCRTASAPTPPIWLFEHGVTV